MSQSFRSKLGRRSFVKISAAASVLTYLAISTRGSVIKALQPRAESTPTSVPQEVLFNNVCANNCKQACRVLSHVYNGKLVFTEMNPMPNERYNRICLRGLSHAQRVYNPNRLKYPMKRVGPRGSGKWDTITWTEAITTIATNLQNVAQKYGSSAVGFLSVSGNYGMVNGMGGAINRFANVFQGTNLGVAVDLGMPLGFQQVGLSYYGNGNEITDIADNARLIIVWGSNMTESDIHSWHFIADALDNGAKVIVIDPHYSVLASKATQWINLTPGSDVALGMSLINVIINTPSLLNTNFVINHTVGPFLVNGNSGLFLRESDVVSGGSSKYMVWDPSSNSAKTFDQVSAPALSGVFTVNAVQGSLQARPALQLLSDRVAYFTPANAQGFTGISPDIVRALATDYATRTPATIMASMGIDRWGNGYLNGRAIATLAALTGNIGVSGATPMSEIAGYAGMYTYDYSWLTPSGTSASSLPQSLMYDAIINGQVNAFSRASSGSKSTSSKTPGPVPYVIKAIFATNGNWVSNSPDQNTILQQLLSEDNIEFFVAADTFLNDTTEYADIVLPATHWFENDDVVSGYMHPYLMVEEKALDTPWQCMSDWDMFSLLAQNMGLGKYFQGTMKDQVNQILSDAAASNSSNAAAVKEFQDNGVARFSPEPFIGYSNLSFSTPSTRMEFYAEGERVQYPYGFSIPVTLGGDPLVRWEEPAEAWSNNPIAKKYPLQCYQEHVKWRVHSSWFNQPWLREIDQEPTVKMNPTDAQARGISDGDYVVVYNDRSPNGTVLKTVFNPGVRPGSVNIPHGWQRDQHKFGGYQELTSSATNPISLNFAYNDIMVEVKKLPSGMALNPQVYPLGQGGNSSS